MLQVSAKEKFFRQRNQDRGCKPKPAPLQDLRAAKRQRSERIGVKGRHTANNQADLANAYEHPLPKSFAESAFNRQTINRNRLGFDPRHQQSSAEGGQKNHRFPQDYGGDFVGILGAQEEGNRHQLNAV